MPRSTFLQHTAMAATTPDPNGATPNGAASNSPGQGCEADAALGFFDKNASCPEWAASQNLKLVTPDPQPFHWQALAGICLGVLMFTLDGSIVNIAIPTFLREFHTTLLQAKWIVLAYLIVIVVFLLPVGRAAVFAGRKNIFLGGLGLFTAGSLLCGSAWDLRSLVAFRVVQGAGAVGIAALMSSLVLANAPRGKIGQSLGMITTFATLIFRVCLWGLGLGVFNAPNTVCIMKSVPQRETGTASALLSLSIMLGQAVGVAGMAAMFHHQSGAAEGGVLALPPAAIVSGVSTTLLAAMIPLGLVLLLNALSAPAISRVCRQADP